MSNDSDATPTEMTEPIAQRIVLANEAAAILAKSRRPAPFTGSLPALLADEIIALAEYLRLGDGSPPEDVVTVKKLRVGDVVTNFADAAERVTRLDYQPVGKIVEVTTVIDSIPEDIQGAATRPLPERMEVNVRLPRPA